MTRPTNITIAVSNLVLALIIVSVVVVVCVKGSAP